MFWKQVKIALVFQFNIYLKTLLEYAQLIHEVQAICKISRISHRYPKITLISLDQVNFLFVLLKFAL